MRTLIRKVILGIASVIALGIAGDIASSVLDCAANAGDTATAASMPVMPVSIPTPGSALIGDPLRRDDIRWAQLELRNRSLYRGSLDGIFGRETRRALSQFQTINGLARTASLDAQTWEALTGNPSIGEGSSTPGHSQTSAASDLGK